MTIHRRLVTGEKIETKAAAVGEEMPLERGSEHPRGIAGLAEIQTATLHKQVYDALANALMSGDFAPGETLSYQRIANQFGVSSMPVRDALRRLGAEGAVIILPKRAVRIPEASADQIEDLLRVRLALEGLATELAGSRLSPGVLNELDALAAAMIVDAKAGDCRAYLARNQKYHFMIYRASGSELLTRLIEGLWLQTGPLLTYFGAEGISYMLTAHHDIVEAFRSGKTATARRLMEGDIRGGMDYLLEVLGSSGKSGVLLRPKF